MALKNVVSYVVDMVTCGAVGSLSCLLYMFLPVHMKETTLCYSCRYLLSNFIKFELFSHTRTTVSARIDLLACGYSAYGSELLVVSFVLRYYDMQVFSFPLLTHI